MREDPAFKEIETEVRRIETEGPGGVRWNKVAAGDLHLLTHRGRDLLLTVWTIYALAQQEPWGGLAVGFSALAPMVRDHWDAIQPKRERARVGALEWLTGRLTPLVAEMNPEPDEAPAVLHVSAILEDLQRLLPEKLAKEEAAIGELVRAERTKAAQAGEILASTAAAEVEAAAKAAAAEANTPVAPPPAAAQPSPANGSLPHVLSIPVPAAQAASVHVSIAGVTPLASIGARIGTIAALFIIAFGAMVVRILLAQRANALAIRNLLDTDGLATLASEQSSDEIELIRELIEGTMRVLKDTTIGKVSGSNYMIQLPWYVIIGPPGAGKTTILKNSGLSVPMAERVGDDPVAGVGGTRYCDWWFTDKAVLIATWLGALARITPMRFNDMPRVLAVLQNLAGPQSPIDALVGSVRENTDLPPPGQETNVPPPAGVTVPVSPLGVAAGKAGGAVTGASTTAALGEGPWPGKAITRPFIPLIQLSIPGPSGQAPAPGRIRDLLSNVYGVLSGVANAPQPSVAAFQIVAARVKDQKNDAFAALWANSALRPEPVRTILQAVGDSAWSTLLGLAYQNVNQAWKQDVLPVCESAIARRYPIYSDAKDEVTLTGFTDFSRPNGALDTFFSQYMAGFVIDQRGTYVPITVDGSRVPVSQAALSQFSRARQIREAFFPNKGPTLPVKFSVCPCFLSPNVLRATLNVDGNDIGYRHEAPRSYDMEWPTRSDASVVSVTLTPVEGNEFKVQGLPDVATYVRMIDGAWTTTAPVPMPAGAS